MVIEAGPEFLLDVHSGLQTPIGRGRAHAVHHPRAEAGLQRLRFEKGVTSWPVNASSNDSKSPTSMWLSKRSAMTFWVASRNRESPKYALKLCITLAPL